MELLLHNHNRAPSLDADPRQPQPWSASARNTTPSTPTHGTTARGAKINDPIYIIDDEENKILEHNSPGPASSSNKKIRLHVQIPHEGLRLTVAPCSPRPEGFQEERDGRLTVCPVVSVAFALVPLPPRWLRFALFSTSMDSDKILEHDLLGPASSSNKEIRPQVKHANGTSVLQI